MSIEEKLTRQEFDWLLNDEVPSILSQLKNILETSVKKFSSGAGIPGAAHISKGSNFLLSLPNSDAVKGLVNISGDSVIRAELRIKFPKFPSAGIGTFVFEQCPWKLQQLLDARNHLEMGLDQICEHESCGKITSGHQVIQLMDKAMVCLSRVKTCLIVPEKHSLSELMSINAQKVLNPPVPEELLVNFHVNCDKLVLSVYYFNILTTTPHQKSHHHDHSSIGHTFEHDNRWYEISSRAEIVCTVPWLKDMIVWINTAQQLCQQLKDKFTIFHNMLPNLLLSYENDDSE